VNSPCQGETAGCTSVGLPFLLPGSTAFDDSRRVSRFYPLRSLLLFLPEIKANLEPEVRRNAFWQIIMVYRGGSSCRSAPSRS